MKPIKSLLTVLSIMTLLNFPIIGQAANADLLLKTYDLKQTEITNLNETITKLENEIEDNIAEIELLYNDVRETAPPEVQEILQELIVSAQDDSFAAEKRMLSLMQVGTGISALTAGLLLERSKLAILSGKLDKTAKLKIAGGISALVIASALMATYCIVNKNGKLKKKLSTYLPQAADQIVLRLNYIDEAQKIITGIETKIQNSEKQLLTIKHKLENKGVDVDNM